MKTDFDKGFRACFVYFRLEKPTVDDARKYAERQYDWSQSFYCGWLACCDTASESATVNFFRALDRGLLRNSKQKKLIAWAHGKT
jgi:hypothetical protein